MASFFDEAYYLKNKAAQLTKDGINGADGKPYTADTLKAYFSTNNIDAEAHYKAYGAAENLNPNPYFNETEYLTAKKALLAQTDPTWATKTNDQLKQAMAREGLNPAEHYEKFGAFEADAKGVLLNPSNAFDANAYFAAKLVELKAAGVAGAEDMSVAQVVATFKEFGLSPVAHYTAHGAAEATKGNIPLVQTVPSEQRVANDPARTENVPGNYNPATVGANNPAAAAKSVDKPADVGAKVPASVSPTVVPPAKPLPTPADIGIYVTPPDNLQDTNDNPVVIVPPLKPGDKPQYGIDKGDGTIVKPGADGKPSDEIIGDKGDGGEIKPVDPSKPDDGGDTGGDGDGGTTTTPVYKEITVTTTGKTEYDALLNDVTATSPKDGVRFTGKIDTLFVAKSNSTVMPGENKPVKVEEQAEAVTLHNIKMVGKDLEVNELKVALVAENDATAQNLDIALQGGVTIGKSAISDDFFTGQVNKGLHTVSKAGADFTNAASYADYKYNVTVNAESGSNSSIQMSIENAKPTKMTIKGAGNLTLWNTVAQALADTDGIVYDAKAHTGKLTIQTVFNEDENGQAIFLKNVKQGTQALNLELVDGITTADTAAAVTLDGGKVNLSLTNAWENNLNVSGSANDDILTISSQSSTNGHKVTGTLAIDMRAGNDTLTITDAAHNEFTFGTISGGDGTDTLILKGLWKGSALDREDAVELSTLAPDFEKFDFSDATTSVANGIRVQAAPDSGISSIIGSEQNDQIYGDGIADTNFYSEDGTGVTGTALTLVGGNGADTLRGGRVNDIIHLGVASGVGNEVDAGDAIARLDYVADTSFNTAIATKNDNELHGRGGKNFLNSVNGWLGNDEIFGSKGADVFEYHTHVTTTVFADGQGYAATSFKALGTDTIHNFELGKDLLLVNMVDLKDGGALPKNHTPANGGTPVEGTGHGIARADYAPTGNIADILLASDITGVNASKTESGQVWATVAKYDATKAGITHDVSNTNDYTLTFRFGDTTDTLTINLVDVQANGHALATVGDLLQGLLVGKLPDVTVPTNGFDTPLPTA